jgi:hypothetical protein
MLTSKGVNGGARWSSLLHCLLGALILAEENDMSSGGAITSPPVTFKRS